MLLEIGGKDARYFIREVRMMNVGEICGVDINRSDGMKDGKARLDFIKGFR